MSVYNGELYLQDAVQSILDQTFPDFEFIIVDDGSTDNTSKVLDMYQEPRVVRLKNARNVGLVESLNRGLARARGEFVARMDADDISHLRRFEKQIDYLHEHPEVGVMGTWMEQIDASGKHLPEFHAPLCHEMIVWTMLFECSIAHGTVMMRRALLVDAGGYDPEFLHAEDTEVWSRLIQTTRFANLAEPLLIRRWHEGSICNTHADTQYRADVVIRRRLVERILNEQVPQESVELLLKSLHSPTALAPCQKRHVISSMVKLHNAFVRGKSMTHDVSAAIGKDLANRVSALVELSAVQNRIQSVMIFAYALYLSPQLTLSPVGWRTLLKVLLGTRLTDAVRAIRRRFSLS